MKKSLEKSKNVLEEKSKMVKQKNLHKKDNTFTIIAMNFVHEQLNNRNHKASKTTHVYTLRRVWV